MPACPSQELIIKWCVIPGFFSELRLSGDGSEEGVRKHVARPCLRVLAALPSCDSQACESVFFTLEHLDW